MTVSMPFFSIVRKPLAEMRSEILMSRWEGRGPTRYQVGDAYKPQAARWSSTAR